MEEYIYNKSQSAEEYLDKFYKFTKDPTLKAMEYLMDKMGNPHKKLKCIHIAGTNGKGSVAEMLNNCLINAGYKVGKFISPHLITYNDGICINNNPIKDEEVREILEPLSKWINEYNKNNEIPVKWFEVITCIVFIYFEKEKCDFVVLETGLGGLTDCTNIVNPMVSILTKIGFDHVDLLGDTIEEIANQKAGIIKEKSDTIFVKQEDVIKIIEETCKKKDNKLHIIKETDIENHKISDQMQEFDYKEFKNIKINLKGKVQTLNASEVLECIKIIQEKGFKIEEEAIKKGLSTVIHRARLEEISKNPLIIFDGGHNESAITNLNENIDNYYKNQKRVYIISILKTKDYKTIVKKMVEDKDAIFIFTSGNNKERYVSKEELYKEAKKYIEPYKIYKEELKDAIDIAKKAYYDRTIFVIGSFYVYKDVLHYIK